jgi:hypothetical protein
MLTLVNIISKFCTVSVLVMYNVRSTMFVTGFVGVVLIRIILYFLNLHVKAKNLEKTIFFYLSILKSLSFSSLRKLKYIKL